MTCKAICETLIGKTTYSVRFHDRNSIGIAGWMAVQLIALAIMTAGKVTAMPDNETQ